MINNTARASHSNLLTFILNAALLNYVMEMEWSTADTVKKSIESDYKNLLKYRHLSGAFSQWNPPQGKPSIYLTALVANSLGLASKYIDVDRMLITRAFSWISQKQRSDGCFEEDGEKIFSRVYDNLTPFALTAFIVAAIEENADIASHYDKLVKRATKCLDNIFFTLNNTHDVALATYAMSMTGNAKLRYYLDRLIEDSHYNENVRYWNGDLNVEIAGYAILSYLALDTYLDATPVIRWLDFHQCSIEGFDHIHCSFIALKSLGEIVAYVNKRRENFVVNMKYGKDQNKFEIDNLDNPVDIRFDVPGHVRDIEFSITGVGFGIIFIEYQFRAGIISTAGRFNPDVTILSSSNYNVQNLRVCLSCGPTEGSRVSGATLVEVYLPSGFVFTNITVNDLNHRIQVCTILFAFDWCFSVILFN